MNKRLYILGLLLVLLSWTTGHAKQADPAADHARIVQTQQPCQSHKDDRQRHFGLLPEAHRAKEESVGGQRLIHHLTGHYSGGPAHLSHNEAIPNQPGAHISHTHAQVIAFDLTSKKLFPFHSFL